MKTLFTTIILVLAIFVPAIAADITHPPYDFFAGEYVLVGVDGKHRTYQGTVMIKSSNNRLEFTRRIKGKTITGFGRFIEYCADGCPAIRVEYKNKNTSLIVLYQFFTDANNYPVLVGFVENTPGQEKPGLETLYPNEY